MKLIGLLCMTVLLFATAEQCKDLNTCEKCLEKKGCHYCDMENGNPGESFCTSHTGIRLFGGKTMRKCTGRKPKNQTACKQAEDQQPPRPRSQTTRIENVHSDNILQPSFGPEVKTNRLPSQTFENSDAEKAFSHLKNQVDGMAKSDVKFIRRHDLIQRMNALFHARQDTTRFEKKKADSWAFDRMNYIAGDEVTGMGTRDTWLEVVGVAEVQAPTRAAEYVMRRRTDRTQNKCKVQPLWVRDLWSETLLPRHGANEPNDDTQPVSSAMDELAAALAGDEGVDLGPLQPHANEAFLFTGSTALQFILRNGLDERWSGDGGT